METISESESRSETEAETTLENRSEAITETILENIVEMTSEIMLEIASLNNIVIAYFSVLEEVDINGVDAIAGASIVVKDREKMGNTEYIAKLIQKTVDGDLFRIQTINLYPLDHDLLVDQAADEQNDNLRPELVTYMEDFKKYKYIFLDFPNWLAYHNLIQCTQA